MAAGSLGIVTSVRELEALERAEAILSFSGEELDDEIETLSNGTPLDSFDEDSSFESQLSSSIDTEIAVEILPPEEVLPPEDLPPAGEDAVLGLDLASSSLQVCLQVEGAVHPVSLASDAARPRLADLEAGQPAAWIRALAAVEAGLPPEWSHVRRAVVLPDGLGGQAARTLEDALREWPDPLLTAPRSLAVAAGVFAEVAPSRRTLCVVIHEGAGGTRVVPVVLRARVGEDRLDVYRVRIEGQAPDEVMARAESLADPPWWVAPSGWAANAVNQLTNGKGWSRAPTPPGLGELGPDGISRWAAAVGVARIGRLEDRGWVRA
ncbi:MAG: hypothetical protein AAFU79_23965, partial [Myxococcota bacterium]